MSVRRGRAKLILYSSSIHPLFILYSSSIHPLFILYSSTIHPLFILSVSDDLSRITSDEEADREGEWGTTVHEGYEK